MISLVPLDALVSSLRIGQKLQQHRQNGDMALFLLNPSIDGMTWLLCGRSSTKCQPSWRSCAQTSTPNLKGRLFSGASMCREVTGSMEGSIDARLAWPDDQKQSFGRKEQDFHKRMRMSG